VAILAGCGVSPRRGAKNLNRAALTDLTNLAIAIAERITKRQGVIDPMVLAENLREVMKFVLPPPATCGW